MLSPSHERVKKRGFVSPKFGLCQLNSTQQSVMQHRNSRTELAHTLPRTISIKGSYVQLLVDISSSNLICILSRYQLDHRTSAVKGRYLLVSQKVTDEALMSLCPIGMQPSALALSRLLSSRQQPRPSSNSSVIK